MSSLRAHPRHAPRGPVVLVVMDGVGRGAGDEADAVSIAATPTLDRLWVPGVRCDLRAHGKAVGLPSDDDMGNSEVGHNALLDCGQSYNCLDESCMRANCPNEVGACEASAQPAPQAQGPGGQSVY